MSDLAHLKAVKDLNAIRNIERDAARIELEEAARAEQAARDDVKRANAEFVVAAAEWEACLSGAAFDPERLRAHGTRVGRLETAQQAASAACEVVGRLHSAARDGWVLSDARCKQSEQLERSTRRRVARAREEHALAAAADHISQGWARR